MQLIMQLNELKTAIDSAAKILTPVWPLKTIIACNPLQGLETMPFERAIEEAAKYYQSDSREPSLSAVNTQTIKWCHNFLDAGQATITMPNRKLGFYSAWRLLAPFDTKIQQKNTQKKVWLNNLPTDSLEAVLLCLNYLGVARLEWETFLKFTLTQLPGWSGYIKYCEQWQSEEQRNNNPITLTDYLAVRLAITCMLWPAASKTYFQSTNHSICVKSIISKITQHENIYRKNLLTTLQAQKPLNQNKLSQPCPDVQLIFCIDVRSEPFRRSLEAQGHYETFGFAGFFGIPVRIYDYNKDETIDACPVLLKPQYDAYETPIAQQSHCVINQHKSGKAKLSLLKAFYQDLKYNFATSFGLVETLGIWCGILMIMRTLLPTKFNSLKQLLKNKLAPNIAVTPKLNMTVSEQVNHAETVLRMIGLTNNFAKIIILCGHGSTTTNNAYASALDCGACGGNQGGGNARILASIFNDQTIRHELKLRGLIIPADTVFISGQHNTTTDTVTFFETINNTHSHYSLLTQLKLDLIKAQKVNAVTRCNSLTLINKTRPLTAVFKRSNDWAEIRPEWGLARNAAFIVAPRNLSKKLNLDGRCFLHSYDWKQDEDNSALETILTAPMIVAEWINTQYLFSTLDNIAYGSGSKITQNVVGKIGIMQGNASDLMHGLPLQSVKSCDEQNYHEPMRLLTVVYTPKSKIDLVIKKHAILKKLFFNGWITLVALDPRDHSLWQLDRTGLWQKYLVTAADMEMSYVAC